ncbi:signal transduction histidine kinase [Nocardioides daedukensis]|uniref:Signal transduction histidine kinase n=1 Tax=Nocardioides daedukensis TaxID=634462 RepID=A0A7Y9UPN6_9ACTN|nr:signal transduction histidine kinase [Nocardioides daedukensis]
MTSPLSRALPLLRFLIHLLVAGLLAVTVVTAVVDGPHWDVVAAALIVAGVYAAGRVVRGRPRLVPVWGAALSAAWLVLVVLTPMGVWVVFPLFFVALSVLAPRLSVPVVGLLTAMAVAAFAWHAGGWSVGAVLGPVIGALVAIGIVSGLRIATEESQRRGRLEERERYSREVHDTLAQGLGSIHLLLGAAEGHLERSPERARALVSQAREVASANLTEARRLVRAQGPADLAERSLPEALARLAASVGEPPVTLRVDGPPTALPGTHDVALLRIAQEAVNNAARHADARQVALTLTYAQDEVLLDVVDDGNGQVREGDGFGIGSMRARAEELGGTLSIEPSAGHGTAIAARLPLPVEGGDTP